MAYHLEKKEITLHDTVRVNCKNGAATDINAKVLVYGLTGECWIILCVSNIT